MTVGILVGALITYSGDPNSRNVTISFLEKFARHYELIATHYVYEFWRKLKKIKNMKIHVRKYSTN